MNQRMMLIIAAALTAFILVMSSGLITYMAQTANQNVAVPVTPTELGTSLDPTIESLVKEREQAYQQTIDEANRRLAQANQQLEQAKQEIAQQAASSNTSTAASSSSLSAKQAQTIALNLAPGAKVTKTPELVSYQGTAAYEVILDRGAMYVDAQSGAILASNVVNNVPNVETNSTSTDMISPEQAAKIATNYRGSGNVSHIGITPDGIAYEIGFSDGAVLYVDTVTGQVVQPQQAAPSEREHDDGDHDQHDDDHEEQEG